MLKSYLFLFMLGRSVTYKFFIAVALWMFIPSVASAQIKDSTVKAGKDSSVVYQKIKGVASKHKFTNWIYEAVFNDSVENISDSIITPKEISDNYDLYKGKIIRKVEVVSLDPFGTAVNFPEQPISNSAERFGNSLHPKSKSIIIRNQLQFKKGEGLDPLSLRESERILRQSGYIRDAKITVKSSAQNSDSVDVVVVAQDLWSLSLILSSNGPSYVPTLSETNFLGLGHNLQNSLIYRPDSSATAVLQGSYTVPNIKRTFISVTAYYSTSTLRGTRGISINRPFYSPLTKWAGGIDEVLINSFNIYDFHDTTKLRYTAQSLQHDYWFGRSFDVFGKKGKPDGNARLVITARFLNAYYIQRATSASDSFHIFQNSTFYLGSIGYSIRKYYKDSYIYRFGVNEDVPEGTLFALVGGLLNNEMYSQYYTGAKAAYGKHVNHVGYVSLGAEYGTFLRAGETEKGVVNLDFQYISDRLRMGRYSYREFINFHHTIGIQRETYENINLNGIAGLYGFESNAVNGKSKMYLDMQSVVYTPWNFIGFQVAPVVFAGFGLVANDEIAFLRSNVYQVYGLGVLVRNEHLIINTFKFSFAFYPNEPGNKGWDYRFNPLGAYDLRFKDFYLSKPAAISYQ